MNSDWQFVLSESSVQFLMACRLKQRESLIRALQSLASDPYERGDFEVRDSKGQPMQIKLVSGFLITYWLDSYVKELRVIRIERA